MNARLSDKVAIVTGSTGGIGEGITRRLAAEGATVVVSGRRVARGEQIAQEIRKSDGQAFFVRMEVNEQ